MMSINLRKKKDLTPISILMWQLISMQAEIQDLKKEKEKLEKQYSLEHICPFPFDKDVRMIPFPQHVIIPKYNKYTGKSDPQDHMREFCTLSMEFTHEQTYLIRLFPRILGGQVMD